MHCFTFITRIYTKIQNIHVAHVVIRDQVKEVNTRLCEFQATTNWSLTQHQAALQEGKKYPCRECEYQTTTKWSLTQLQ